MKQSNKLFNLLLFSTMFLLLNGYQNLFAQQNSDVNAVEAANQSFYKAFSDKNISEMDKLWAHSSFVSTIHPDSNKIVTGWDGVKRGFEDVFKTYNKIMIISRNPKVHVEGNAAWTLNNEEFQGQLGDKTEKMTVTATNIFVKQSGKWLMAHHHASVLMQQ